MATKENNCKCVVCQVEQSLLDSLSTQTARIHFQALAANHSALNHFDSPADVIARLHEHERVETDNHNAWNGILHALVESLASGTTEDIGQQLLLVAYAPAIHKACSDIGSRFPQLSAEDIAQQASLIFLESTRLPMMQRQNGHLQIALVRNFRKELLRWALKEMRSASLLQNSLDESGPESASEETSEASVLLDKMLKQALRDGLLSPAEHELLRKFKCEGFEANELADMAGKSTNAVQMRLKRIIKRLRHAVCAQPEEFADRQTDANHKNSSPQATIFSGSLPISNSEGDFSPELSHEPQSEPDITQVAV